MNKKTQMFIGVAAVGVVAYLLWQKSQKPKSFMNAAAGFCPDDCLKLSSFCKGSGCGMCEECQKSL
jgi:hypothetical protein